jgi:UV DNA damage repair endonuclease
MIKKIGFACKTSAVNPQGEIVAIPELNFKSTTITWLNRQRREEAEQRLWDIMVHNVNAVSNLIEYIGGLDENLRMVRIGSDLCSAYTEPNWSYFWRRTDVRDYLERHLAVVGIRARQLDVRLSMHPGQFVVLASTDPGIVNRSIEEFEYHADLARWMGYGKKFQDFKINVHISGRAGPPGICAAYTRLSPEARNCITIENEENAWGLDDCLSISDIVPIVLDIHHHWAREGEYISPTDPRVQRVVASWRGARPTCHYSVSREDYLVDHIRDTLPDYHALIESGFKKQKLRAHSDYYWNTAVNEWALKFLEQFDIMCESKCKNLASFALASQARELNLL